MSKVTKRTAHYGLADSPAVRCGTCFYFTAPNECEVVQGTVRAKDVCDYWLAKDRQMRRNPKRQQLTPEIIAAASLDAGNVSMRKAGRIVWSMKDYRVAAGESYRLWAILDPDLAQHLQAK